MPILFNGFFKEKDRDVASFSLHPKRDPSEKTIGNPLLGTKLALEIALKETNAKKPSLKTLRTAFWSLQQDLV